MTTTTVQENKAIVRDFVNRLTNEHDPSAWEQFCSEGFIHHFNIPEIPPTRDGAKMLSQQILATFPDTQVTIDLLLAEGDLVVERASTHATHSGEWGGMQPTGRPFSWTETHVYRLRDGKIVEHWPEVRLEKLLWQLRGRDDWFRGPAPSLLSKLIATAMGGVSRLYRGDVDNDQTERNREVVRRYIEEFKNQQRFFVFPRLYSHEFGHHFDFPDLPNSMETFVNVGQNFLSAFPDVKVDLQMLLADGDYVVERNVVTATHQGVWGGVEATNKPVSWTETHTYRLRDGKIVENWPQVNFERILMQIKEQNDAKSG